MKMNVRDATNPTTIYGTLEVPDGTFLWDTVKVGGIEFQVNKFAVLVASDDKSLDMETAHKFPEGVPRVEHSEYALPYHSDEPEHVKLATLRQLPGFEPASF